jgi:hypothetical protein
MSLLGKIKGWQFHVVLYLKKNVLWHGSSGRTLAQQA